MKALKILKSAEQLGFSGKQIIISEYKLNKAIEELEELELCVKYLEEYRKLARMYLQTEKCSCGALKVKGYLCSNEDCTEE